ncbi:hypothetical protein KDA00_04785 [Candidatus Saccharibacteria bacterium]|nr:hypothetical protein [Candidatus Saccharibacteria bacterium]
MSEVQNCYEAIVEVDDVMRSCLDSDQRYYVLGGIATSAIRHHGTVFDHQQRLIIPTDEAADPLLRESNGTVRDIDILVDTVLSKEQSTEIVQTLKEVTPLVVSVFGFDERKDRKGWIGSRADNIVKTVADWTSRRTIDDQGIVRYELFPLEQAVQPESFDPWKLILPSGSDVQVFHPAGHMLAYRMRSISGVRYKDKEKLDGMTDRIVSIPEFMREITEGNFKEWLQFALGVYGIRDGNIAPTDPSLSKETTYRDLARFATKSRALGLFESNETIIKIAQSPFGEKALSPFTRTK